MLNMKIEIIYQLPTVSINLSIVITFILIVKQCLVHYQSATAKKFSIHFVAADIFKIESENMFYY